MSIHDRYLNMLDLLRTTFRRISLSNRRWIVGAYVFLLLILIISIDISPFGSLVEAGKPSARTILAPKTVQYIDKARTREEREAAEAAIEDVYIIDKAATARVEQRIADFFKAIEEVDPLPISQQEKTAGVLEQTKTMLPSSDIEELLSLDQGQRATIQSSVVGFAKMVMEERITSDTLEKAREKARNSASQFPSDAEIQRLAREITSNFIAPNNIFDKVETELRKTAARNAVNQVITTKLQGEVVVSKGEVVSPEKVELLKSLGFRRSALTPLNLLYSGVFVLLLIGIASMFLARYRRIVYDSPGLLALMGNIIIVYAATAKILAVASRSWSLFWGYLMPAAAVAMIAAVLFDTSVAIVMVITCALITGVVTGGNYYLTAFTLLGGLFPALYITRFSTRNELRKAGLYTSLWIAVVAFGTTAIIQLNQGLIVNTGVGFLNGVLCTVIALGSLPFLETTFRITTNTWLLELASPEQKMLKDLSIKAPGTHSHSVMVANLAEAAARVVGSDPMLARVAAYYHDVGKILRPQFFIENQPEDANMHANISPNLSTLIITSHIRDGVEMLEQNHLPPDLIDIIRQHHGTSVVRYFYQRAQEESGGEPVDENRFRYHFEKPRKSTAGILMLADSVEAGARTLQRPSAATIEQTVERIVNGKLEDGQLDECDLTFSDIVKIKEVFARILIGSHHPRINYPAQLTELEMKNAYKNKNGRAVKKT